MEHPRKLSSAKPYVDSGWSAYSLDGFYHFRIGPKFLGEPIHFLGKKELFNPLTNKLFRSLGGMPVDRTQNSNTVSQAVAYFKEEKIFRLALAPEGTRKKVTKLKSGFYHIATKAKVPIFPVVFDFKNKNMIFKALFYPTGDQEADMETIASIYEGIEGKIPKTPFTEVKLSSYFFVILSEQ